MANPPQWTEVGLTRGWTLVLAADDAEPDPPVTFTHRSMQVEFELTDIHPDVVRVLWNIPPGFPLWYRTPLLALPPAPPRLALPWGDTAYTTCTYSRWLHGNDADTAPGWNFGPPGPLTPSSEGPRRASSIPRPALAPLLARVLDGLRKVL